MPHEAISVFDMFKIGIGPSSSHTLGPWKAAQQFVHYLIKQHLLPNVTTVKVHLYGSLAKTGKGHGTDVAVQLGLCNYNPETFDVAIIDSTINDINHSQSINLAEQKKITFNPIVDIVFLMNESLPYHPNGLSFLATMADGNNVAQTYYSIGGGFIEMEGPHKTGSQKEAITLPFPINDSEDLLHWCRKTGLSISDVVLENETAWRSESATKNGVLAIWHIMANCIYKGVHTSGTLPGGLNVQRRAAALNKRLIANKSYTDFSSWITAIQEGGTHFQYILDWVSCFALAVNEENASFGRVVTAPTNGAAGVIPAVLMYYITFCHTPYTLTDERIIHFLLTASEVGSIFKKGATISAAMGGCQAEIGVSSAMAAAALTEAMGGSQRQALMAAEIAMEHHLGLTCDPIAGLVQVPCIERNTMGAIKAITASQLALQSSPDFATVSLDNVIKTMWQTAQDMNHKYKETAEAGLAVNVSVGLSEC